MEKDKTSWKIILFFQISKKIYKQQWCKKDTL